MINDMIADGITRIRNAYMRRLEVTTLIHSRILEAVVDNLQKKGYIDSYNVVQDGVKKSINVTLKYNEHNLPAITEIKRVSKPGRRVYKGKDEIKRFKNGYGSIIISTSKGVITNDVAHKEGVGGEVLCTVW